MVLIFFYVLQLCFAVYLLYYIIAFLSGAPFVPSTNPTAQSMIELAHIKPNMTVYDLGSGEGRLLFLAAKKGAKVCGVEINPILVFYTWLRIAFSPYKHIIRVLWKDFWRMHIADADVVLIYLLPWRMERLEKKLLAECKPGTIIVSNSFLFPHLRLVRQDSAQHVYVYAIPNKTKPH